MVSLNQIRLQRKAILSSVFRQNHDKLQMCLLKKCKISFFTANSPEFKPIIQGVHWNDFYVTAIAVDNLYQ